MELVIPDFINYIDEFALTECINLREIHLPGNSIYWHSFPFQYCPSLEWLDADEHNTHYKSVDGVLYSRDLFHIVSFQCNHKSINYTILERVSIIYEDAFANCSALENLNIPNSVLHINDTSFSGCVSFPFNSIEIMDTFDDVDTNNCVLHVPSGTRWEYRHHLIFGKFKNIATEEGIRKNIKPIAEKQNQNTELYDLPF